MTFQPPAGAKPLSPVEPPAAAAGRNERTLRQQAAAALATNRTFLALPSPTAAQNAAEIKALARQNNGIIRLLLGQLEATD